MIMTTSIKGAKKGQEKPRRPSISKDTASSTSTVKILYGLGEGEISGLVNGAKSIFLDGTPLLDDAGKENFSGVTWDFRAGTNDQEYIKGFPDVSNELPVGVELKSTQPWVKAFTDTQLSALRVRFKWNRLSKTDPDNGDVTGYKIDYAIDLQTDGGVYKEVLRTKIEDKTSAGYERTHRVDLPRANSGWQIRIRRITPNDPSEFVQDTMMIEAVAEVIDVKLTYPNTALLGIQYNAETFSSIAKIAVHARGLIIRVPSNYNAVTRTYTGIWDGTFKDAYTNNPAWIYFDLCTQWRYGLGERLNLNMIDKWSLYALGQYCDQMVSDGKGGTEPRFTCNVYLQTQEDAYKVLQNIAGIFRAMSYWDGERISVDADVPQDPVYTFSRANVVDGNFEYSGTRARDRHTVAKVAWDNPANAFETEYEYVRDEKAMAKYGVKVLEIPAFGCTSQGQAQRSGLWALKTEQLETRQVSFSVGLDGAIPKVGNVINVSDETFAGRANGGRVATVNNTQRIIEVDRDVTAKVGDVLIVNGGSGQSERRNISAVSGRRITVSASFISAEPEHIWAIESADLKLMRFRVMSINENGEDGTFDITAIQHEPQKYSAIDFGADVKPTDITIIKPDTLKPPSSVSITSRHRVEQGQTITTLVVAWSQVEGAVAYDVEWRKDDGSWIKVPRTGGVSVDIDGVYSGNYLARVRSINAFDVQSNPTSSVLTTIKGKAGLPPVIVGLKATGVLFGMELSWGFQSGSSDAAYTEIQMGTAPNVNVSTLTKASYPTDTYSITGLQGNLSQSYRARLVDKLGFTSPWSGWVTATTDANAGAVLDLLNGKLTTSQLDAGLKTKVDKIDGIESGIAQEIIDRKDEDERVVGIISTTASNWDNNLAAVQDEVTAITSPTGAIAKAVNTLQTAIDKVSVVSHYGMGGDKANWTNYSGDGEIYSGTVMTFGNNAGDDQVWYIRDENIPLDAGVVYKVTARVRNQTAGNALYFGVAGVAADGTTFVNSSGANSYGSQFYLENYSTADSDYRIVTGYIGSNNTQLPKGGRNLPAAVKFFRPLIIANYPNMAGKVNIDYFNVDVVDGQSIASIEETKESVNGIYSKWSIKADVNGYIGGLGIENTGQNVDMIIRADGLYIAPPTGTGSLEAPFVFITKPTTINGVTVPVGAYLRSVFIMDASIESAHIKDAAITNAKIANLAVDSAKIANAAITSAKIGNAQIDGAHIKDLAVDTLKIADNAITIPRSSLVVQKYIGGSEGQVTLLNSATMDYAGGFISVEFGLESLTSDSKNFPSGLVTQLRLRIYRGTLLIREVPIYGGAIRKADTGGNGYDHSFDERYLNLAPIIDKPPLGIHTYRSEIYVHSHSFTSWYDELQVKQASLTLTGVLK